MADDANDRAEDSPIRDGNMVLRGKEAEALYAVWREDYASRARESSGEIADQPSQPEAGPARARNRGR
jgi:hypothetical protein